jgi:hypothetical protein
MTETIFEKLQDESPKFNKGLLVLAWVLWQWQEQDLAL